MNSRPIFVLAFVLVIGLALGYAFARLQAGRYVVHSAMRPEGFVAEMYRYDTYTGRTWICHPLGVDASWKEVSEGNERFTSSAERNTGLPRQKDSAMNSGK
ncbi:MAG: hypothetical protein ABSG53_06320 [Thermoguttaceae bacterium]|jgi:hypothetical protein